MTAQTRRLWICLHKWIGLVLGAHLALLGLTGSALVFYRELDAALNPSLFAVSAGSARPASAVLAAAQAAAGGPVEFLFAPDPVQPTWTALWRRDGHFWSTNVDPVTSTILGSRDYDGSAVLTIYRLHADLLLKDWRGEEVVGVLGLVLVLSAGSGLYLWWPRQAFWRAVVTLRTRPRQILYLDLHNLLGAWSCVVFLVVGFTGVAVVFPGLIRPLLGVTALSTLGARPDVGQGPAPVVTDIDHALDVALGHMQGAVAVFVAVARPPDYVWRVGLRPQGGNDAVRSTGEISIDARTGRVLDDRTPATSTLGERIMTAQLWVHNGALFGWTGRMLVFLSGLTLPATFVTGLLFWWRKRRARRDRTSRRTPWRRRGPAPSYEGPGP